MKVVIPAAGKGSRFFPATKSQPKEMLPVHGKPIIQYVVEEAAAAGADDILIVTGRNKRAIEDHFDSNGGSDSSSDSSELKSLTDLVSRVRIHYVRQSEPRGLADAVGLARHHVGNEPFGVLLGDTINVCDPPLLAQLWARFQQLNAPIVAVETVPDSKVSDYGIVEGEAIEPSLYRCHRMIEKPSPSATTSRLGVTGAYVLTPAIFPAISGTSVGKGGESQLTDALQLLLEETPVYASTFSGTRYDVGDWRLWLRTNLEFASRDPRLRDVVSTAAARSARIGAGRDAAKVRVTRRT